MLCPTRKRNAYAAKTDWNGWKCRLPVRLGQPGEFGLRQAGQEQPAIGLGQHPGVQDRDQSPVGTSPDQAAHALAEFDQRIRQRQLREGIAAAFADAIGLGLGHGMVRRIEGQAGDQDLGQRLPGNVHPRPEAVRAKQDRVAQGPHPGGQFGAGGPFALQQQRAGFPEVDRLQDRRHRAQVGVAGEKDE